ncbi:MAG: mandelate racemase/muconate lactonizing enzyme family protein [Pseudonocardia sp.]|uniref:mandelate racemase/muconate lactonizing enzyme family protein n=1 Tax=unclassified Pseudonocardia TaxID=2619320 RepID=UPI00086F8784|nr:MULTISPECIES: mandelate racemase/muconate lactonizing enzyme family protein [unclassified Pseudonocardia]MBN9111691.1 mandelate racemase/muconate lactonizing enzyme family protein [Pseudonocardia sp.]ODV02279.1 MAG: hypothetical protein ABT15_25705 [Pseudonocardia sp. SCN 73-27]
MRIRSIEPIPVTFPLRREPMSLLFVKITTDDGLVGYGEACDSYGCSYASVLATLIRDVYDPLLAGEELVAVEPLTEKLRMATRRRLGDVWIAAQARSAVEIALWDLLGKASGRSVSALIGRVRDAVEIYASSTFLDEGPASFHHELISRATERGVTKAKVRLGPAWHDDLRVLTELRGLLPSDVELMIDGSETYTQATTVELSRHLADLGIRWFEEPMPQTAWAGIASAARASAVPIAYGEHLFGVEEAIQVLESGVSVLQPDAAVNGGISVARRMAQVAASRYGARVVPHISAGPLALTANLHLAATVPAIRLVEYSLHLVPAHEELSVGAKLGLDQVVDGMLPIPDGPGLGVDLDEAAAAKHPYSPPRGRVVGTSKGLLDRFNGDV